MYEFICLLLEREPSLPTIALVLALGGSDSGLCKDP